MPYMLEVMFPYNKSSNQKNFLKMLEAFSKNHCTNTRHICTLSNVLLMLYPNVTITHLISTIFE